METVKFQIFVFSITVYGGIIIGLVYDIYRAAKGAHRSKGLFNSFWDILFLLISLIIVVWAIFSSNYGDLRIYVFIGFIVGFFLYERIISRIAVAFFTYIFQQMRASMYFIVRPFSIIKIILEKKIIKVKKKALLPKKLLRDMKKYYKLIIRRDNRKQDS